VGRRSKKAFMERDQERRSKADEGRLLKGKVRLE
jgi:hypothetical protein